MALQVYSTLTRKKEPFHKKPGEPVTMYVCGPTVYKPSHIGHMVGPVIFDTVKRYLTYLGYPVKWVVNITDVDDKLIVRAKELNTTVPALAEKMTADYYDCLKKLNVTGIDEFPKATEHIPGMIQMISTLIEKGYAYPAGGDVYFDVSRDKDYGKLCNRDPEQLEAGSRIEVSDKKRNPGDFALWKGAKPGEPIEVQFDSPWGKGRPGWHIECSAMSKAILGDTLDIHGGGLDLQFPHHENELAQSESATDQPFARVWMHNGLLRMGKSKMAGSVGNVWNIADALKVVSGDVLRFFILNTHYRSPIDMGDWEGPKSQPIPPNVENTKRSMLRFFEFFKLYEQLTKKEIANLLQRDQDEDPFGLNAISAEQVVEGLFGGAEAEKTKDLNIQKAVLAVRFKDTENSWKKFHEAMQNDFNTGAAVAELFFMVSQLRILASDFKIGEAGCPAWAATYFDYAVRTFKTMASILGLFESPIEEAKLGGGDQLVSGLMQLLLDLRANLRDTAKSAAKDNPLKKALFDQTDLIRTRIAALGVTLEDRPGGTTWRVG